MGELLLVEADLSTRKGGLREVLLLMLLVRSECTDCGDDDGDDDDE